MSIQKEQKSIRDMIHGEDLEHFIKSETECCICTTPLLAQHEINYMTLEIHETLYCTQCQVTLKNTTSTLH